MSKFKTIVEITFSKTKITTKTHYLQYTKVAAWGVSELTFIGYISLLNILSLVDILSLVNILSLVDI